MDQALLVYGLQQSRPECRMDGERSVDDLMRQKIVLGREFNNLAFSHLGVVALNWTGKQHPAVAA